MVETQMTVTRYQWHLVYTAAVARMYHVRDESGRKSY